MIDSFTGNEVSGADILDNDAVTDTPSVCGGVSIPLVIDPDQMQLDVTNGTDCVTGRTWRFAATAPAPIGSPSGSITELSQCIPWNDQLSAAPATQWQTHNPNLGPRMVLNSGAPVALDGAGAVSPLGAGSSFYITERTAQSVPGHSILTFFDTAGTDTELTYTIRLVDNNNKLELQYLIGTTTWNLIETIAGVPNTIATAVHDLAADPGNQHAFDIVAAGANVTITDVDTLFPGTNTTLQLTGNLWGFLFIAAGAGNSGWRAPLQLTP